MSVEWKCAHHDGNVVVNWGCQGCQAEVLSKLQKLTQLEDRMVNLKKYWDAFMDAPDNSTQEIAALTAISVIMSKINT